SLRPPSYTLFPYTTLFRSVRRVAALFHHSPPQLPGRGDPARIHHSIRAVVADHAGAFHVPHVRRPDFHGPGSCFRPRVPGGEAAATQPPAPRRGTPCDGGLVLRLFLSGLDRGAHL